MLKKSMDVSGQSAMTLLETFLTVIEVGQPWRNTQAGLTEAMFAPGRTITVIGQRPADSEELRLKAKRLRIDGLLCGRLIAYV